MALAPRVLLLMPDQWPRALFRAALREVGYDAIGSGSVATARRHDALEPGRGVMALVIADQDAVSGFKNDLRHLLESHGEPPVLLVAHATMQPPSGAWMRVIRRPVSVDDLVTAVQSLVALPENARRPLDSPGA
jgi:hypothetical protein